MTLGHWGAAFALCCSACGGARSEPVESAPPAHAAESEPVAGALPAREPPNAGGPSFWSGPENPALGRCLAAAVQYSEPKLGPQPLEAHEERQLRLVEGFVSRAGGDAALTVRVPPETSGSPHEMVWDLPTAKYARARILFERRHWPEATLGFREFFFSHGDRPEAVYAAQLYLEGLNVLGSRAVPKRPECYDALAADLDPITKRLCPEPIPTERREACTTFAQIGRELPTIRATGARAKGAP